MEADAWTGIVSEPIDIAGLHKWAKHPKSGAVVTFSGITRDSFEGKHVAMLSYDCYVPRAERTLAQIAQSALKHPGVNKVALVHRIGNVPLSEESVYIVVSAAHRQEGWRSAEKILEDVKRSAEIWKLEVFEDDSRSWVQGTHRDSA